MYSLTQRCPTCKYYYEYMFGFSSEKTRHFQPMKSKLCHYEIPCIPVHIEEHSILKMFIWPNGPKSLNRDSGKITKLTKVLRQILIADWDYKLQPGQSNGSSGSTRFYGPVHWLGYSTGAFLSRIMRIASTYFVPCHRIIMLRFYCIHLC